MADRRVNRRQLITRGATGLALAGTVAPAWGRRLLAQEATTRRGGVPRVALSRFPQSLALDQRTGTEAGWLSSLIYDSPLRPTAGGDIVASLSVAVMGRELGTTIELITRTGVLFSNGTPMTSADIAWSIEQAISGSTAEDAWRWSRVESVESTEDGRVRIRLTEPDATLPATLASVHVPVIPSGTPQVEAGFEMLPPGTGPFWPFKTDGAVLRFRRNGSHWVPGQPRFDGVNVIAIEQEIERTTSLVTGLVDVVPDVPSLDIPLLRDDARITLQGDISRRMCALVLRMDREPLDNVLVRRLLASTIDREELVQVATAGTARPAGWLFPPEHWAGPLEPEDIDQVDPADIREGFSELGLLPGWALRLVCSEQEPALANAAIMLQEQLANVGIAVTVDLLEPEALASTISAGDFDLLMSYLPAWIDPHEVAYPWLHTEGQNNVSGYSSSRMDRMLDLARSLGDLDQRGALYRDVQRLATSDVPLVPLFATPWVDGVRSRIEGYLPGPPERAWGLASAWFANP